VAYNLEVQLLLRQSNQHSTEKGIRVQLFVWAMSSLIAKFFGGKRLESGRSELQFNNLGQIVCQACAELDERCTARLILAPKVNLHAMQPLPKSVQLHSHFAELESCGQGGCTTCRFWVTILLREFDLKHLPNDLARSSYPIIASLPETIGRPWIVSISTRTFLGERLTSPVALENTPAIAEQGRAFSIDIIPINRRDSGRHDKRLV
jgi:hypothetical protein